jgi:ganglioside GM2 activator
MKAFFGLALLVCVCSAQSLLMDYLARLPAGPEPTDGLDPVPFTITNCGTSDDIIQIQKAEVAPMPVTSGAYINATLVADTALEMKSIQVSLTIERQLTKSTWVKIPCVSDVGSCNYDNICDFASKIPECPSWVGIECKCPIPAHQFNYNLQNVGPVPDIPAIAKGNFRVTVKAQETTIGKQAGCFVITASTR